MKKLMMLAGFFVGLSWLHGDHIDWPIIPAPTNNNTGEQKAFFETLEAPKTWLRDDGRKDWVFKVQLLNQHTNSVFYDEITPRRKLVTTAEEVDSHLTFFGHSNWMAATAMTMYNGTNWNTLDLCVTRAVLFDIGSAWSYSGASLTNWVNLHMTNTFFK